MCVCTKGDPLWSARLLHTNPKAIKDAHHRSVDAQVFNSHVSLVKFCVIFLYVLVLMTKTRVSLWQQVPPEWG